MDIIEKAREFGKALQETDEYIALSLTQKAADADSKLQEMIGNFNLQKIEVSRLIQSDDKNPDELAEANAKLRELYDEIMLYPPMAAYNTAKSEMDKKLAFIEQIITGSANGDDPDTIEENSACTGSCDSCSGCH